MKQIIAAGAVVIMSASAGFANEAARLSAAAGAVRDIREEIPQQYWTSARCVLVIPELKKAAFIVGGEYGKGVMSCRAGDQWSAPVFMQIAKGSWGFQVGAEQADLVLLVMNDSGVQKLLKNKVNLGADASVAAGPLGRRGGVSTDAVATAEILSYSRTKGLFAGIDLSGGVLRPDEDANKDVYGAGAVPSTILATREMSAPPEAAPFLSALKGASHATAPKPLASSAPSRRSTTPADEDIRGRVLDIQQAVDRLLADATPGPVGTSGALGADGPRSATAAVDRARLMQIREQLDGLIATLNHR
ncbi:MAG TPA: lipid-binding SYLF domain-containing protein [Vicinamibacterales bacterium]|jgi:lipid-binding SYLF domain-containing protein|nr:lipid-binding SYLF domain-containing protein [Vicinamibacterales bacterium]